MRDLTAIREDFADSDDDQVEVFRRARIARDLNERKMSADSWPETRAILEEKGAVSTGRLSLSSVACSSLRLAQVALVAYKDIDSARKHLDYPVRLQSPTFSEIASLVREGVDGKRIWDKSPLSLESEMERILCFVLGGHLQSLREDYAAIFEERLFDAFDHDWARPYFTRQFMLCALERYELVSFEDYAKKKGRLKRVFFFGYERLVSAIAEGDASKFSAALADVSKDFLRRRRSKEGNSLWGYGYEGRECFDVLGTALCRLARSRGLQFTIPPNDIYPSAFQLN